MIGNIIEVNIWKDWILRHVVIKFGWIKVDNSGDVNMSSHVNVYIPLKFFIEYLFVCLFVCMCMRATICGGVELEEDEIGMSYFD